jgi:hypothetical protein
MVAFRGFFLYLIAPAGSVEHTLNLGSGIGAAFAERSDKQKL